MSQPMKRDSVLTGVVFSCVECTTKFSLSCLNSNRTVCSVKDLTFNLTYIIIPTDVEDVITPLLAF